MSGGTFDYKQYKIGEIADIIERVVNKLPIDEESDYIFEFSPETIAEFRKAVKLLRIAEIYAQRVDWLLAGDDGEDNFHKRLWQDMNAFVERGQNEKQQN